MRGRRWAGSKGNSSGSNGKSENHELLPQIHRRKKGMKKLLIGVILALFPLAAQPGEEWSEQEGRHLKNIKQVTRDYMRAGEGYFSPDGQKIIFQAEEKDTGNPFYQIFVMDLKSGAARRVSPG